MKKMSLTLSIVVLAAMLLAACAGGASNQNNQGTPGADVTMQSTQAGAIPGTGSDLTSTPAAGTGTETGLGTGTATTTAGGIGTETGTATTTAGGTGLATDTATSTAGGTGIGTETATSTAGGTGSVPGTSTPSANVPVTGAQHQFVLLSDVLKMNVNDNSGTQVGTVTGVVMNRPMSTASNTSSSTSGASAGTATPTVGIGKGTLTTPTTSAGTSGSTGSTMAETGNNPRVAYVIVQTNNAGGSTSNSGTGSSATSTSGTATPTTGTSSSASGSSSANAGEVLVPWEAFDFSNASASTGSVSALTLNSSVDASALASAPAFDQTAVTGSAWDTGVTSYWSGKGLSIPATGAETSMMEPVIVRGNLGSVNVVDASGKTVAQVRDLVIDATTGEVMYAIVGGGSLPSSSSLYVVPVDHLTWNAGQGQGANTLGDFNLKFDASQFNNAPTINSVSDLDFSSASWNSQYDTYWTGVSTNP
jgi:sporulation protein YlmC with PRC-barrel domain